jgi:hypothetical protein
MRVSLLHTRVWVGHLGTILLPGLVACGGRDLLLPDDRAPVQVRAVSGDGQSSKHPCGADRIVRDQSGQTS